VKTGTLYWFTRLGRAGGPAQTVLWQRQELERFLRMMDGEADVNEN
jgi:hypothetical protein